MADTPIPELEARLAAASVAPVDPAKHIDALIELAWGLRGSDVSRASKLAEEARDLAIEQGYKLGQARATRTMAMTIRDPGRLRALFDLAQEAMVLFDEVGDGAGRAASRDFLASIHEFTGDLTGGLEFALDALSIARELGDPIRQGYALSSVGGILAASGEVEPAIERLEEALQLFQGQQDHAGIGTICSRLSRVFKKADRLEQALTYAEMCRDAAEQTGEEYSRYASLNAMAEIEDQRGNLAQAERLYHAALESLQTEMSRHVLGAETQVALARLLIQRGALTEAEQELNDLLKQIEGDSVSIVVETSSHEALAELCESQGRLPETIQHLRKAQALREQISRQDARNKRAQVEARAAMETARRDAEIHKLRFVELHGMQAKLVEAEKMALLGKLAAGTAHELNSPLGALRSNTRLLETATRRLLSLARDEGELSAQARKLVSVLESCTETSEEAMQRIAAIARNFGRFTQLDQAELRSFDVREGLDSALALLEPTIPAEITLERRFEEVPAIKAWPRELNHAFMTVLQNAIQAMDGAGVVSAETGATEEQVLVRVQDSGRGMSQQQAAHLFDVAWSEDGTRTRMRLGLSAAYSTMQKHGGGLEVKSAPGQGTTVTFRFPIP